MHHLFNHSVHCAREFRVGNAVENLLAFAPRGHKTRHAQQPQMMRNCRTAHADGSRNINNALFGVAKEQKDAAAACVAQLFENLGHRLKPGRFGQSRQGCRRTAGMRMGNRGYRAFRLNDYLILTTTIARIIVRSYD